MELGIYTFGDLVADPVTGNALAARERTRDMLAMAKLADDVGLDVIGVGEHHGLRYVNSATATLLSAMGAITTKIRLTSASTLLSTADPVRTFQEFATADLVSNGRIEVLFGRGAFTDNFPLFGFRLEDYDALFVEKLALFAKLNASERVTWKGRFRTPLENAEIAPRPVQGQLPVWLGALSPESVTRAAILGYPLAMPILGGTIDRYAQLADHYRRTWIETGHAPSDLRIAVFSHLHIATSAAEFYPYYAAYLKPLFKGPMPRAVFDQWCAPDGSLVIGTPEEVSEKITRLMKRLGATRYVGQIDIGGQPFDDVAKGIELYAREVARAVRERARAQ